MRAGKLYPGPCIGPVRKVCAAKKLRATKHPGCLAPGIGVPTISFFSGGRDAHIRNGGDSRRSGENGR